MIDESGNTEAAHAAGVIHHLQDARVMALGGHAQSHLRTADTQTTKSL